MAIEDCESLRVFFAELYLLCVTTTSSLVVSKISIHNSNIWYSVGWHPPTRLWCGWGMVVEVLVVTIIVVVEVEVEVVVIVLVLLALRSINISSSNSRSTSTCSSNGISSTTSSITTWGPYHRGGGAANHLNTRRPWSWFVDLPRGMSLAAKVQSIHRNSDWGSGRFQFWPGNSVHFFLLVFFWGGGHA